MLVMDVPTDINQIDPKQWFGLTGRQFLCVSGVVVCAVGAIVCQFLAPSQVSQAVNQVIIIPIVLLGIGGLVQKIRTACGGFSCPVLAVAHRVDA